MPMPFETVLYRRFLGEDAAGEAQYAEYTFRQAVVREKIRLEPDAQTEGGVLVYVFDCPGMAGGSGFSFRAGVGDLCVLRPGLPGEAVFRVAEAVYYPSPLPLAHVRFCLK